MNRDDIIRMAREACDKDKVDPLHNGFWTITQEELERFAALVAAERHARACRIVTGLCISDNNAREICEAILARDEK